MHLWCANFHSPHVTIRFSIVYSADISLTRHISRSIHQTTIAISLYRYTISTNTIQLTNIDEWWRNNNQYNNNSRKWMQRRKEKKLNFQLSSNRDRAPIEDNTNGILFIFLFFHSFSVINILMFFYWRIIRRVVRW